MNKQRSLALLIIVSIFVLALKDSASLIHTVLHYFPNNPWHQHEEISSHKHHINPMEIHKHLQHNHTHAHDVMDHIQHNKEESEDATPAQELKQPIKIDCYFQSLSNLHIQQNLIDNLVNHFCIYLTSITYRGIHPPCQPPQV